MQLATKCRACGIINILKYVNHFLSTTLILGLTKNLNLEVFSEGVGGGCMFRNQNSLPDSMGVGGEEGVSNVGSRYSLYIVIHKISSS